MFIKKMSSIKNIIFVLLLNNVLMSSLIAMDTKIIATGTMSSGDGYVSGIACLVTPRCDQEQLNNIGAGNIVVTSIINKSWTKTSLKNIAGIVTEQEGSINYAAKLGKPIIVVPEATKKIMHGSSISVDCTRKIVYEVFNSVYRYPINSQNLVGYFSSHSNFPYINWFTPENSATHVSDDKKVKNNKKEGNMSVAQSNKSYCNAIPVTEERLLADMGLIRTDVTVTTKNNIWKAWYAPKWAVLLTITERAYASIPYAFFDLGNEKPNEKDKTLMEEAFANLQNDAIYIQETKEKFKREILKNKIEIDNSEIAEFLYAQVVANVSVSDDLRKELTEDPKKMDELARRNVVNKTEYMRYTLRNFATRYYLEKELELKKQKV